eukprot:120660_1
MVSVLFNFILFIGQIGSVLIYCDNAYQCVGTAWEPYAGDSLYSRGYKSLYGPSTSMTLAGTSSSILCYGAYSCAEMSFISTGGEIDCYGSHSCANIDKSSISYIDARSISCYGSNSCQNTNIRTGYREVEYIGCFGDKSCSSANISARNIYAHGSQSLYGSTIDSNDFNGYVLTVYLDGYQSGFGATIICRSGDTCNIYCYFNGCQMLFVFCEDDMDCNVILNTNDPTITIPPIKNQSHYNEDAFGMIFAHEYKTETLCNENSSTTFVYDNYRQKRSETINMNVHNGGPVCCRGDLSCSASTLATAPIQFTETPQIMVCSGSNSCTGRHITTTGPTFCEGAESCHSTNIVGSDYVYCLGWNACYSSTITQSKYIYCSSYQSCYNGQIESNGNDLNIHLLGHQSGRGLDIYCTSGDECVIKCGAFESCQSDTILYCNNNCMVDCNDDTGCPVGNYTLITESPTANPTFQPTTNSQNPTFYPTINPSKNPTFYPTINPSKNPTFYPTVNPTKSPTFYPTVNPTKSPTFYPTV